MIISQLHLFLESGVEDNEVAMGESPGGGNIEENQRTIAQNNQNSCDMISVRDPSSVKGQVREIFSTFDSIFSVTENWVEPKPIIRED